MSLFKAISEESSFTQNNHPLYSVIFEQSDKFEDMRYNKHRILVILMVKMFKQVLEKASFETKKEDSLQAL